MNSSTAHNSMPADGVISTSDDVADRAQQTVGTGSSLLLFCFSLSFRLIYMIQSFENPLFGVPLVDASSYVEWARKMVDGIWLWDHVGNYLPIYQAFLAVQQIILGADPLAGKIVQHIMGAGTAVLLAQIGARAWHRKVGLIGGYLIASYWMLVVFEFETFAETFSIFFSACRFGALSAVPINFGPCLPPVLPLPCPRE